MTLSHHARRTQSPALGAILRRLLLALLVTLFTATLGAAAGASVDFAPQSLSLAELTSIHGGTCSSQCDDGGGSGDDEDEDDEPRKSGRPYWVETDRTLNSRDSTGASLEDKIINRSSSSLDTEFSYRHRTLRRIDFGGGWGEAFSIKVGGEVDYTRTRTIRKVLRPYEVGKVYTRFETERYTVDGAYYQDYSDGSRKVIDRDSGRYLEGTTVTGYVTYFLN